MSDRVEAGVDALLAPSIAALEAHRLPEAIAQLRQAIERHPKNAELFHRLGECYWRGRDFGRAIHAFERAIALNADHFASYRSAADAAVAQASNAASSGNDKASRDLKKFAAMYLLALGKRQHRQFFDDAE